MNHFSNLLLIGGTGRNIGKTTLAEMIIKKFSLYHSPVVLKTSMLLPGEEYFHGEHKLVKPNEFLLKEEYDPEGTKDSQRYLRAGAQQSFFLSVGEKAIEQAMNRFWKVTGTNNLVIAESNVLRQIISPGVFVMIRGADIKPQALKLLSLADEIFPAMNILLFEQFVSRLQVVNGKWMINPKT